MKPIIPFALLGALLAVGAADAAATDPVGYTTTQLAPNQFTLVGLTLQSPAIVAGVLDGESASSVTDTDSDFTALLTTGSTYILELNDGTVQEVTSWAGGVLNTPNDISGLVTPGTTSFTLRKATTVSDVFGATNTAGLTADTDGDFTSGNDLILIFNGIAFDTVYYFDDGAGTTGWFDDGGLSADNKVIAYPDGFFVQRVAGSPIDLVTSGTVKTKPTGGVLAASGFNYLSSVAPAASTLASSGLSAFVTASSDGDFTTVDNILIQKPDGSYTTHYYFDDGAGTTGWFDDGGLSTDTAPLEGGFLLLNRGASKPYSIAAPTIAPPAP